MLKKMILLSSASLFTGFHFHHNLKVFQESEDEGRRKDGKKSNLYRKQIIEEKENDFNENKR